MSVQHNQPVIEPKHTGPDVTLWLDFAVHYALYDFEKAGRTRGVPLSTCCDEAIIAAADRPNCHSGSPPAEFLLTQVQSSAAEAGSPSCKVLFELEVRFVVGVGTGEASRRPGTFALET